MSSLSSPVHASPPARRHRAAARALVPATIFAAASSLAWRASAPPAREQGPVTVRYVEGALHGFLQLKNAAGERLADGDLLQVPRRNGLDSRMVFHFRDSSFFEERVRFTQRGVFRMESYELVQRGRAFEEDLEVKLAGSGQWSVRTKAHDDGEVKSWAGTLDLPEDVYNGMVVVVAKNLARADTHRVHIVAFTPKPRVVGLDIAPEAAKPAINGRHHEKTVRYVLKPKLGTVLEVFARVLGKFPPDSRLWIVTEGVPGFVQFEGPMYSGPVWRLELATPRLPQ